MIKEILQNNEKHPSELLSQADIVVFDMDGTLYLLDGENNGYKNSTLHNSVVQNAVNLIIEKDSVSQEKALEEVTSLLENKEYLSVVLGNKYGMSREEYFNYTWDINPDGIIRGHEHSSEIIKKIHQSGKTLILLTSAPKVWQEKVFSYLDVQECFTNIYSGETFLVKDEIFSRILSENTDKKVLSIGDQQETDIAPAIALGMTGFHVKHPNDLLLLV